MNGRNASLFSSTNSKLGKNSFASNNVALLFAVSLAACCWTALRCYGQIEVDAYISDPGSNKVFVIDTSTATVVKTLPLAPGSGPIGVAVTPDGRFAYITNAGNLTPPINIGTGGTLVSVIDVPTNTLLTTIPVGTSPAGVAVTPDATSAYVTNRDSGNVSVIDTATNTVTATIPIGVGSSPEGVAITPGGKRAYVANSGSDTISVINTDTVPPTVVDTISVGIGNHPLGITISPDGSLAYVSNNGGASVSVIRTSDNIVVGTISPVGPAPFGVSITPDGSFLYVSNNGDDSVSVRTSDNSFVRTIPVGPNPAGISITPDGSLIYVANFHDGTVNQGTVSEISAKTNTVLATISVGSNPESTGRFIGPNIIVAQGGPLSIANDAGLTTLGFGDPSLGFQTFVDFNGGTLRTTGSLITSRTISLLPSGGIIDTNGFNSQFSGNIINSGSLTKIGAGTLTLSGNNSYSGGTRINGGILAIGADVNLGAPSGTLIFSGGTLETMANFSTARATMLEIGGGTFQPDAATTFTEAGTITGIGGLTKAGAGILILSGNNNYTGGTTVLAGTLRAGTAGSFVGNTAFTVNGGELDLNSFNLTMSSLNGTGGVVNLASAALTIDDTGTDLYSGIIQGAGSLTKIGAGTQILSGNNTFSGGTTINEGILQISADANLGAAAGGLTFNGGTLQTVASFGTVRSITLNALGGTFEPSAATTFTEDGAISGVGGLTKFGAGTVILGGNNSYTGGTTVLAGTLQAGSAGGFVSNTAYAVNGGVLDLNGFNLMVSSLNGIGGVVSLGSAALTINNTGTDLFSGNMQGSGSLIKTGVGTQTLSGNNSYNGGTTVSAGTLQAGSAGGLVNNTAYTVNGGILDLNNFNLTMSSLIGTGGVVNLGSAALTINNASTNSFSGVIQGAGSLTKNGSGILTLSGNNTYSGGTKINAGTLTVNSAQALGLGNVVVNGGVLRADQRAINARGNYTQNTGGTLQLSLGGSAPGQYDVLNVSGHTALDGTLQLLSFNGFQPKIGDKLTLVLGAGGVSGQFANVLDPFGPLLDLELNYFPNSVVLEFGSNFTLFARTPNQLAVAAQLDRVAFDPRESQLLSFLQNEPLTDLPADFDKISPDSLSAMYEISFSAANIQAANLENRFAEIRNGSTGFTSSLNISNSPGTMVEGKDGKGVIEPSKNVLTPSPENRWGVWVSGSGEFVNVNGDGNAKGYNFDTGGVSLGLDYRLTRNFAVGITFGYAHTSTNLTGNGSIDVNSGRGGLYAAYSQSGFYLNGYAGGGYNSYNTQRDALGGGASGSTNGGEFDGYIGAGYEFHCGSFTFGPIASLEYTDVSISGYNEAGSLAPLRILSQSQDSLRTNVGLSASYTCRAGKVQITPSLRASWQHEYFYSALPIEAAFASGAGSVFTVHGPAEGHDSALINAGVDVQWTPTIGTYFGYNGEAGRSNYGSNAVICSVHWDF